MDIEIESGIHASLEGDSIELSLARIASVAIADRADVLEHNIVQLFGSTSHFVRLRGGGEVRFAFSDAGEVLELSACRVCVALDQDGRLTFEPYRPPGDA